MRLESLGLVRSNIKTKQHSAIEMYTIDYIFREFIVAKVPDFHKNLFNLKEYYVKDTTNYNKDMSTIGRLKYMNLDELKTFIRIKKLEHLI